MTNTHFIDTYYFLALVNTKDSGHAAARRYRASSVGHLVTTTWILVEFADALSAVSSRRQAARFVRGVLADPSIEVLEPTNAQFLEALMLYESRLDKEWSLTDCISFTVMENRGIRDALTQDRHFEQRGFNALLKL